MSELPVDTMIRLAPRGTPAKARASRKLERAKEPLGHVSLVAGRDTRTCTVLTAGHLNRKVEYPKRGRANHLGLKGGKGFKGKGKKAYFMEYNPTHYTDYDMSHVYVLSTVDENLVQSMAIEKAILDTGATESVAGVAMMARLIDNGLMEYTIRLDDRPSFRFGQWSDPTCSFQAGAHDAFAWEDRLLPPG